jgi:hypothetical protein
MNTRRTFQLIDTSINDLQLSPKRGKQAKVIPIPQSELSSNPSSTISYQPATSIDSQ